MDRIDLRSDTVTLPSEDMRAAMARAPVGDDQYGEDPSVNALQERVAALLGKEAAIFLPSGTMANQIGLKLLTQPGDDVLVGHESHIVWHESGAAAFEQLHLQECLEVAQQPADRRLRHRHQLRCLGDAARHHHRAEGLHLPRIDPRHDKLHP